MRVRGPRLGTKRVLMGVRCMNFYNSSLGACLKQGPVIGVPIVPKRRINTMVSIMKPNMPRDFGGNVGIALGPCAGYKGYTSYQGKQMGTYRRGRALNMRHGNIVYRCTILP